MNRLQEALAGIGALLDRKDIGWALIGGIAVSVRAEPRFTRYLSSELARLAGGSQDTDAEH